MLVAYFLKKSKQKVLKIVKRDELGTFEHDKVTYNINPDAILWKKAFGLKWFRYSDYFEGNPNPIVYDIKKSEVSEDAVFINPVAIMFKKIMKWWVEWATLAFSALSFFVLIYLAINISGV